MREPANSGEWTRTSKTAVRCDVDEPRNRMVGWSTLSREEGWSLEAVCLNKGCVWTALHSAEFLLALPIVFIL